MADSANDFERQVTDTLRAGAQAGPDAVGLADAARRRAQSRRRTGLSALGAVLVIGLLVPVGVLAFDAEEGPDPDRPGRDASTATDPVSSGAATPTGFHVESWHGVSVEVPNTWGYGPLGTWCAAGGELDDPIVERPGITSQILCTPRHGYGMSFAQAEPGELGRAMRQVSGSVFPEGAWVGSTIVGDVRVLVSSRSEHVAAYVLGSATASGPVDPNGCPAQPGQPPGDVTLTSVCHYDAAGRLELSEALPTDAADAARAAVETAPVDDTQARCDHVPEPFGVAELRIGAEVATVTFGSSCVGDNKMMWRGQPHVVTPEVMYWVLSPSWPGGSVGPGVTLPPDRRLP